MNRYSGTYFLPRAKWCIVDREKKVQHVCGGTSYDSACAEGIAALLNRTDERFAIRNKHISDNLNWVSIFDF